MKHLIVAAVLGGVCAAAGAASSAGVRIDAPRIVLTDLKPQDRLAPSYTPGGASIVEMDQSLGPTPASSDAIGDARFSETERSVGGTASGAGSAFLAFGDRWMPSFTFTATGMTRVTVEVPYTLSASIDPWAGAGEAPHAYASFELGLVAAGNLKPKRDGLRYELLANLNDLAELDHGSAGSVSRSGVLSLSFDNLSHRDAVFAFRGEMVAWGRAGDGAPFEAASAIAPPVPEPGTWALMSAGLLALGVAVRRRRETPAAASR